MTDGDISEFLQLFISLSRVLPLKGESYEIGEVSKAYFKAMRYYPFSQVKLGAERCIADLKYFPKPVEWIRRIPRAAPSQELPELSPSETSEYLNAELRHYDGDPCGCHDCRNAGVDHRFTRFVPDFDRDDREVRARIGQREIVRGHWAHGDELRRWYAAKDAFWDKFHAAAEKMRMDKRHTKKKPFTQRLEEIFAPRPKPIVEYTEGND